MKALLGVAVFLFSVSGLAVSSTLTLNFKNVSLGTAQSQSGGEDFRADGRYVMTRYFGAGPTYGKPKAELSCHTAATWMLGSDLVELFDRAGERDFRGRPATQFRAQVTYKTLGGGYPCKRYEEVDEDQGPVEVCVEYDYSKPIPPSAVQKTLHLGNFNGGSIYVQCVRQYQGAGDQVSLEEVIDVMGEAISF